ncbi:MAG TPA: hypothetical protein VFL14_03845 [Xanthomonadales bacterium]|nr:hypothetical protein [Xanthomonadales bacterium]
MRAMLVAFAALLAPLPAPAGDANGPADVVRALYAAQAADAGPFFQDSDRALVDRYFIPALADLVWKDANGPDDEVGVIDGDPLHDAQDMEIADEVVHDAKVDGDDAEVHVTFTNFGEKKDIAYLLQRGPDGAWRIANIDWGHDTLYGVLKAGLPE